jgi:hypothetical protein
MKFIPFLIIIVNMFAAFNAAAEVRKSAVQSAFLQLGDVLTEYQRLHGDQLPKSWIEINKGVPAAKKIMDSVRDYCDVENRYVFPGSIEIRTGNGVEQIIIMAKGPGAEGDDPGSLDPVLVPGRLLIVKQTDGSFAGRHYREKDLKTWFANAGHAIENYTGEMPPPPPPRSSATPLEDTAPDIGHANAPEKSEQSGTSNATRPERSDRDSPTAEKVESKKLPPATILISALLIVAIGSVFFAVKRKESNK